MSVITNYYGNYEKPKAALALEPNESTGVLECAVIIVGYSQPFDIDDGYALADRLDYLITEGMKLNLDGTESTMKRNSCMVEFAGGFCGGYRTYLRLTTANMQLSLGMAAQLLEDLRKCINMSLAMLKSVSRGYHYRINGRLMERVLDTECERIQKAEKSIAIKNGHRKDYLMCVAR